MAFGSLAQTKQRMLRQCEQRHRPQPGERRFGGKPRENARRRLVKRAAAGILASNVPAPERRRDAAGERAVGGHQRHARAGGLDHLAQRDRDRVRLLLGIGRLDHRNAGQRLADQAIVEPMRPKLGRRRRPKRLGHEPSARPCQLAEADHHFPVHADSPQQHVHGELRVAGGGGCRLVPGCFGAP